METGTSESRGRRIPSKEKTKAVLRVLKGEDPAAIAEEFGVSSERLARWNLRFIEAGEIELAKKKHQFRSRLWKHRKLLVQWASVIAVLVLTVFFLTRFFESGGAAAAP